MEKSRDSAKPVPSGEEVKKQVKASTERPAYKSAERHEHQERKHEEHVIEKSEIENVIVQMHNEGKTQSEIGQVLKEKYKIKSLKRVIGKTVLEVLKGHKLAPELPEDLTALLKRAVSLIKHAKQNKQDTTAQRGYSMTVSKIRRLTSYYKKKKILPNDWTYSEEKASLLVK